MLRKRVLRGLTREEEGAMRQCLRILAPRYGEDFPDVIKFVESQIQRGEWFPALQPWEAALLFYPTDRAREDAFLKEIKDAIALGELVAYGERGTSLIRGSFAAWVNCPPVPLDSPLAHWLPAWMRQSEPAQLQPSEEVEQMDVGQRRFQKCIDAGMRMPENSYAALPDGIGALALQEGVSKAAFSKSVKRYIERLRRQP